MNPILYEEVHRAQPDAPYVDTDMSNIQYFPHYHEEIELIYVVSGEVIFTYEGRIGTLSEGQMAIVLPYQIHNLESSAQNRLYILKILSDRFDFSHITLDDPIMSCAHHHEDYNRIYRNMEDLIRESALPDEDPLKPLAVRAATDRLLVSIARLPLAPETADERIHVHNRNISLLKAINQYLEAHFSENISLEDAANACHMSIYYFAHNFKSATGTTFLNYLNRFRLEQAKYRMIETEDPLSTIAMQCGFSSIRTFNRCFMTHFGQTPSAARRNWQCL